MAGTITETIVISVVNGNYSNNNVAITRSQLTQTNQEAHCAIINVGTSEEVLDFGDVANEGKVFFKNLDEDNYVDIGPESGGAMIGAVRLLPEEGNWFRLKPGVVWRAQANTAPCKIQMELHGA